jgi:phage shock protein C
MHKLYRSRSDHYLAGICGGLGDYLEIDSTVIRLLFIFLWIMTGIVPLTIAYVISIWIIPLQPSDAEPSTYRRFYRSNKNKMIAGICGAIAEKRDIDPTVVRLMAVLICLITGIVPLTIIYMIGWMILPLKRP